ncbi:hypothetical protein EDB84DRAFT_1487796 [Lactarius hengduanensis]|nr:hypothetical protein EDB84DRAFT_1487796 [Lactarius hengduanensis]
MQAPIPASPISPTVRYTVRSSDVLSVNRVNVAEEKSERVIWYKERLLSDNEIIEHLVDNATSKVLWEIHRPLRGWYIHLRAPNFPRGVFVPLVPVPPSSPYHSPGSLKFSCRTSVASPPSVSANQSSPSPRFPAATHSSTDSDATLTDATSGQFSQTHTYPPAPTPPSALVAPPSPSAVHAKLDQLAQRHPRTRPVISQFMLSPHTYVSATPASEGPLPDGPTVAPTESAHSSQIAQGPAPFFTFHDTTPVFSVGSSTGVFEVHIDEVGKLGVDLGFWIAIALAYGEFLGDREGYLAAAAD